MLLCGFRIGAFSDLVSWVERIHNCPYAAMSTCTYCSLKGIESWGMSILCIDSYKPFKSVVVRLQFLRWGLVWSITFSGLMLGCIGFLQLSLKGDERKSEDGKSGFIQMPIFGYKMPYHRYLSLSILMMLYFVIKSFTRCRGRCTLDVNGKVLGAKCPLYLVSESQR